VQLVRRGRDVQALGAAVLLTITSGIWSANVIGVREVAPETLADASGTQVTTAAGVAHAGRAGERLAPGDTLSTSALGHATLLSPGRRLLVGPGSAVVVGTGSPSYDVRSGQVGLEVRRGTPAVLRAGTITARTLTTPAIVRVDRSFFVRVASFRGGTEVAVPGGARLALGDLAEVAVPGVALPSVTSPISYVDPAATGLEAALVPSLARSEGVLLRLAEQVDADPYAPTAFGVSGTTDHVSEVALPRAIALTGAATADREARVARSTALRSAGGAWSVIAAILQVRADRVTGVLSGLLRGPTQNVSGPLVPGTPQTPGLGQGSRGPGNPLNQLNPGSRSPRPGGTSPGPGAGPPGSARPSTADPFSSARPGGASPSPAPSTANPSPGRSPVRSPSPSPSPSPTPDPGLVGGLLGTVGGLTPSPSPSR
jgi:hypothetical protein